MKRFFSLAILSLVLSLPTMAQDIMLADLYEADARAQEQAYRMFNIEAKAFEEGARIYYTWSEETYDSQEIIMMKNVGDFLFQKSEESKSSAYQMSQAAMLSRQYEEHARERSVKVAEIEEMDLNALVLAEKDRTDARARKNYAIMLQDSRDEGLRDLIIENIQDHVSQARNNALINQSNFWNSIAQMCYDVIQELELASRFEQAAIDAYELAAEAYEQMADKREANWTGKTKLHYAAYHGELGIYRGEIQNHIDNGIDVNVRDKYGRTPLHDAYTAEAAQILLNNGADIYAIDNDEKTPFNYAVEENREDVIRLLRKYEGGK